MKNTAKNCEKLFSLCSGLTNLTLNLTEEEKRFRIGWQKRLYIDIWMSCSFCLHILSWHSFIQWITKTNATEYIILKKEIRIYIYKCWMHGGKYTFDQRNVDIHHLCQTICAHIIISRNVASLIENWILPWCSDDNDNNDKTTTTKNQIIQKEALKCRQIVTSAEKIKVIRKYGLIFVVVISLSNIDIFHFRMAMWTEWNECSIAVEYLIFFWWRIKWITELLQSMRSKINVSEGKVWRTC